MLITKKRYAGEKFEFDAKESKFTSMGLVFKRRDNAPILKYIYYGVTNCIMKEKNIQKSIKYIEDNINKILENKFDLNMFIISKTLKDFYKDPESVAHKVLAERMGQRDPGNKPSSNERIPYAFIKIKETPGKDTLLGDRIEHINYIKDNKLALDYYIYIEKQLMKPISQIFELVVEQIKGYPFHKDYFHHLYDFYYNKYNHDIKKTETKISDLKQRIIQKLIFKKFLVKCQNEKNNVRSIDEFVEEINEEVYQRRKELEFNEFKLENLQNESDDESDDKSDDESDDKLNNKSNDEKEIKLPKKTKIKNNTLEKKIKIRKIKKT